LTDAFMEEALRAMETAIEAVGYQLDFKRLYDLFEDIVATARSFIDHAGPADRASASWEKFICAAIPNPINKSLANLKSMAGKS